MFADKTYILDGAMGTMLQRYLSQGSGKRGREDSNESLNLNDGGIIQRIHREYIEAGADIIETNTFGANRISQAEFGKSGDAAAMAAEGARLAREAADRFARGRKVLVAGSVGPTSKSLSLCTDASDPSARALSFDELSAAYFEQIEALTANGADLILLETCFDALNAKAAIYALENQSRRLPVIISASCDTHGRLLTGQSLRAFYESVRHAAPAAFGLNCSFGADGMERMMKEAASFSEVPLICYPNAGLPDERGNYLESPEEMAGTMARIVSRGHASIVGGCCGTTPAHIRAIKEAVDNLPSIEKRKTVSRADMTVSGLEAVEIDRARLNFTDIGERTNVAGSRKFARLIASRDYAGAADIALRQIENGAGIIDINMDDALLDSTAEMQNFIRIIQAEPEIAKAALMIDSSHWDTIVAGLKNAQGKCIVNSISLKDGQEAFIEKAREIRKLGGAIVVMAFDEQGQATDFARKTCICRRAYDLLLDAGIDAENIIFDTNILTIATGVQSDRRYAVDFIDSVKWIKRNLPGALTSGGVSNLSFAFRGNDTVRQAMHSVFLYHAINAGLDMAIVNPGMLQIYDDIEPELRTAVEDVILDRREDATERLVELAGRISGNGPSSGDAVHGKADLKSLLVRGREDGIEEAVNDALKKVGSAAELIEGTLMDGMKEVGRLFAEGKMFLPQVIKSARVMKRSVAILEPFVLEESAGRGESIGGKRPLVVVATVEGDVHDIGKNITATILSCNGFDVCDLGVMVDSDTILSEAALRKADIIGVSGLISPSLSQMEEICRKMNGKGMDTPLIVGGAATSALHTALVLAPIYNHVYYGGDASATSLLAGRLMNSRQETEADEHRRQARLAELHKSSGTAGSKRENGKLFGNLSPDGFAPREALEHQEIPVQEIPLNELYEFFDWKTFYAIWGIKTEDYGKAEVEGIRAEAEECLKGLDCITSAALHWEKIDNCDAPILGLFAASVRLCGKHCGCCEDNMLEKSLALTLADAASEWIGSRISVPEGFKAIRPAAGYPSCPDHSLKRMILDRIPDSEKMGITLTESYAMIPESSVCGFVVVHREAKY